MMFEVGDRVSFDGQEEVVIGIVSGTSLQFRLMFVSPNMGRHTASAAEDMVFTQFYPVLRAAKAAAK